MEEWQNVQIVEYTYDYNNVWICKTLDTNGDGTAESKTIFIPENYQTTVQLDDTDLTDTTVPTVTHHYLWTPGQQDKLLADTQITTAGSTILWSLTDHLGTVRDIIQQTSSGLTTQAHIIYDAYGNILSCKDSTGQTIDNPILFGYTGKMFDTDTALQNNINRWYDSTVGRWLSTDPIEFQGNDTNLYRYVGNKTLVNLDFNGLEPWKIFQDNSMEVPWGAAEAVGGIPTALNLPLPSPSPVDIKTIPMEKLLCKQTRTIEVWESRHEKHCNWSGYLPFWEETFVIRKRRIQEIRYKWIEPPHLATVALISITSSLRIPRIPGISILGPNMVISQIQGGNSPVQCDNACKQFMGRRGKSTQYKGEDVWFLN